MRPGAKGFLLVVIGLVVGIALIVAWGVWTELKTLAADDPISHFMADTGPLGMALFGFGVAALGCSVLWLGLLFIVHFHWPAKSRWRKQDEYIATHGGPKSGMFAITYKNELWRIHTGGK